MLGLRDKVREFYDLQVAVWRDMTGLSEPSFDKAVELAARSDALSDFAAKPHAAKSMPSTSILKVSSGIKSLPSTYRAPTGPSPSALTPSSDASRSDKWLRDAADFQAKHPMPQKSAWFDEKATPPASKVKCWNCGEDGFHKSVACPNRRVDLRRVIVAALASLGGSVATPGESDVPDPGKTGSEETVSEDRNLPIGGSGKE